MGYIYKITNTTNNKCYIGQTNRSYKERWQEHKRDKNKEPYKDWPLYRMLNQIPEELVSWEVLEETDDLNEREKYWIKFYNSNKEGYNITNGGNNGTKYDYQEVLNYWLDEGNRNFTKTAEKFGSSSSYISEIIHSMGYERRDWTEINSNDHDKSKRAVNQIDIETGMVIKTFKSIKEGALEVYNDINAGKTISNICKGIAPTLKGYSWQYIEDIGKPIVLNKQIKIWYLPTLNLTFNSLTECAQWFMDNNICRGTVLKCVSGSLSTSVRKTGKYYNIPIEIKNKQIITYYKGENNG